MTTRYASLKLRLALIYAVAALLLLLCIRAAGAAEPGMRLDKPLGEHMYYKVGKGEDFYDIAQKFDIGIGEMRAANPAVNESKLKAGELVVLPTAHLMPDVARQGIVINLPERRLYYFDDPSGPMTFPVTVGKEGWETPTGVTYIANKRQDPVWTVPDDIRAEDPDLPAVVPAGPDNPLGKYAMDLGFNGIRIHGTNNPKSIGKQSSHGCIRMYPADIEKLFNMVPLKTKVTIINQPYKFGWQGDTLVLEVSPPAYGSVARSVTVAEVKDALNTRLNTPALVDWSTIDMAVMRRDGMPVAIGRKADATAISQAAAPPAYLAPEAQTASATAADETSREMKRESIEDRLAPPAASEAHARSVNPPGYDIKGTETSETTYYANQSPE